MDEKLEQKILKDLNSTNNVKEFCDKYRKNIEKYGNYTTGLGETIEDFVNKKMDAFKKEMWSTVENAKSESELEEIESNLGLDNLGNGWQYEWYVEAAQEALKDQLENIYANQIKEQVEGQNQNQQIIADCEFFLDQVMNLTFDTVDAQKDDQKMIEIYDNKINDLNNLKTKIDQIKTYNEAKYKELLNKTEAFIDTLTRNKQNIIAANEKEAAQEALKDQLKNIYANQIKEQVEEQNQKQQIIADCEFFLNQVMNLTFDTADAQKDDQKMIEIYDNKINDLNNLKTKIDQIKTYNEAKYKELLNKTEAFIDTLTRNKENIIAANDDDILSHLKNGQWFGSTVESSLENLEILKKYRKKIENYKDHHKYPELVEAIETNEKNVKEYIESLKNDKKAVGYIEKIENCTTSVELKNLMVKIAVEFGCDSLEELKSITTVASWAGRDIVNAYKNTIIEKSLDDVSLEIDWKLKKVKEKLENKEESQEKIEQIIDKKTEENKTATEEELEELKTKLTQKEFDNIVQSIDSKDITNE